MDCVRCGTRSVAATIARPPVDGTGERFMLVECGQCGEITAALLRDVTPPYKGTGPPPEPALRQLSERWRVLRMYPLAAPAEVATFAPAAIKDLIGEGFICLNSGALVAGTLVARTAVQAIARDLLTDQAKRGTDLYVEIDQLSIPEYLKQAAHGIRLLGNIAAHEGAFYSENVEATTLQELLDFTVELVRHLYEMPARARELRERAQDDHLSTSTSN